MNLIAAMIIVAVSGCIGTALEWGGVESNMIYWALGSCTGVLSMAAGLGAWEDG